ncbi:ubiquitin carboxyl-terminal hydrolase faf-x-related [Anaeramoeba ignava]|uniref:ubiquitinyl hydrolase 1 n=1 Tax=Anaeramoeba ignava TaxID=1746090 RepID=A0A9Q0LLE4_ANAIG|nr:ubiquitin carboxyl-terminal hydrolase faf-x-related [Anaeramoeba ignava]
MSDSKNQKILIEITQFQSQLDLIKTNARRVTGTEFTKTLNQMISITKEMLKEKNESKITIFMEDGIMIWFHILKERQLIDKYKEKFFEFYQISISFVVNQLSKQMNIENTIILIQIIFSNEIYSFESVSHLLKSDEIYYKQRISLTKVSHKIRKKVKEAKQNFVFLDSEDEITSLYYLMNLQYFGVNGGFRLLIKLLESNNKEEKEQKISFDSLTQILKFFYSNRNRFLPYVFEVYVRELIEKASSSIEIEWKRAESTNDFWRNTTNTLSMMGYLILAIPGVSDTEAQEKMTRLYEISDLERRSNNESIKKSIRKSASARSNAARNVVVKWMEEKDVIQKQIEENPKDANLIAICSELVHFLGSNSKIKDKLVEYAWKIVWEDYGADRRLKESVNKFLLAIISVASYEQLRILDEKIGGIGKEKYSFETVEIIGQVAFYLVTKSGKGIKGLAKNTGIEILWKIAQDEINVPPNLSVRSKGILRNILSNEACKQVREQFRAQCAQNIQEHKSVFASLSLLKNLLEDFGNSGKEETVEKITNTNACAAEKTFNLTELVINDLEKYTELAREGADKISHLRKEIRIGGGIDQHKDNTDHGENSQTPQHLALADFDSSTMSLVGNKPHKDELQQRLNFLAFLISSSEITLSFAQFERLWFVFVERAAAKDDIETFWDFLGSLPISNEKIGRCFDTKTLEQIFNKVYSEERFSEGVMRNREYTVFAKLFISVNEREKKIEPEMREFVLEQPREDRNNDYGYERQHSRFGFLRKTVEMFPKRSAFIRKTIREKTGNFVTLSPDFYNLKFLWNFVIDSKDPQVARSSRKMLTDLYTLVGSDLGRTRNSRNAVHERLLSDTMTRIEEYRDQKNEQRVKRCLSLLRRVVEEHDRLYGNAPLESAALKPHKQRTGVKSLELSVLFGDSPTNVIVHSTILLSDFKSIVAKRLAIPLKDIAFFIDGQPLLLDDKSLDDIGLMSSFLIQIKRSAFSQQNDVKQQETNKEKDPPKSNEENAPPKHSRNREQKQRLNLIAKMKKETEKYRRDAEKKKERERQQMIREKEKKLHENRMRELDRTDRFPAFFLSQKNNFDFFLDLLTFSPEVSSRTWNLIRLLPTNAVLALDLARVSPERYAHAKPVFSVSGVPSLAIKSREIVREKRDENIDTSQYPNFHKLLPSNNFYTLLYSLEIIQMLILVDPEQAEDALSMSGTLRDLGWCRSFVSNGGIVRLMEIITDLASDKSWLTKSTDTDLQSTHYEIVVRTLGILAEIFVSLAIDQKNSLVEPLEEALSQFGISPYSAQEFPFLDFLLGLIKILVALSDSEAKEISHFAIYSFQIVEILFSKQEHFLIHFLEENQSLVEDMIRALLLGKDAKIRSVTSNFLKNLSRMMMPARDGKDPLYALSHILPVLLEFVSRITEYKSFQVPEFFSLLMHITLPADKSSLSETDITFARATMDVFKTLGPLDLINKLVDQIKVYPVCEKSSSKRNVDWKIKGILDLVSVLLSILDISQEAKTTIGIKNGLITEIFDMCLFRSVPVLSEKQEENNPEKNLRRHDSLKNLLPKCQTDEARQAAFQVLFVLTNNNEENFQFLLQKLEKHLYSSEKIEEWDFSPVFEQQERTAGYVGLKNQGATCYMNSVLQQLFLNSEFREGILESRELRNKHEIQQRELEKLALKMAKSKNTENTVLDHNNNNSNNINNNNDHENISNENFPKNQNENNFENLENSVDDPNLKNQDESLPIQIDKDLLNSAQAGFGKLKKNDNQILLEQAQNLFYQMQQSQETSIDPIQFCRSFKDFDGNPINLGRQQDANEFLNMLFERIESSLGQMGDPQLLKEVFGGKLIHQVICHEKSHRSEREEPFFTISLQVNGKRTLEESLQLFIEGDILNGDNQYFCNNCNKKVDALKRCCIKYLPNTLILHLKRFEFDLETMQNIKLNSYLEFPKKLDMKPYTLFGIMEKELEEKLRLQAEKDLEEEDTTNSAETVQSQKSPDQQNDGDLAVLNDQTLDENLLNFDNYADQDDSPFSQEDNTEKELNELQRPDDYYDYELIGVVVHSGTSSFGHYYSFIRERNQNYQQGADDETEDFGWNEFNDRNVHKTSFEEIKRRAFGSQPLDSNQNFPFNAYMLFYERKQRFDYSTQEKFDKDFGKSDTLQIMRKIRKRKMIQKNSKFQIYDPNYFNFLLQFVEQNKAFESQKMFLPQFAMTFLIEILSHSKAQDDFDIWAKHLQPLLEENAQFSQWFLQSCSSSNWISSILLGCPFPKVKLPFVYLLDAAMKSLVVFERPIYSNEVDLSDGVQNSILAGFIDYLLDKMEILLADTIPLHYMMILAKFAGYGEQESSYLIRKNAIDKLIQFYMTEFYEKEKNSENNNEALQCAFPTEKPRLQANYFFTLVEIIKNLWTQCITNEQSNSNFSPQKKPLAIIDVQKIIEYKIFFEHTLLKDVNITAILKILSHFANSSSTFNLFVEDLCSTYLNQSFTSSIKIEVYFSIFRALLLIDDHLQKERTNRIFMLIMQLIQNYYLKNPNACAKIFRQAYSLFGLTDQTKAWEEENKFQIEEFKMSFHV